jgi:acetyl-CoA carboxylase biotin carboxyl carrier protein
MIVAEGSKSRSGSEGAKGKAHPNSPGPFNVETIHYLVRLMQRYDLAQIDLKEADKRVRLSRSLPPLADAPAAALAPSPASSALPSAATPPLPAPAAATSPPAAQAPPPTSTKNLLEIKSPTPGTFYSSPSPDAPPFVQVGSKVSPNTVVCIIEAMKVFNEIQAEVSGTIVSIHVENQQSVEYGQVLFKVDPS